MLTPLKLRPLNTQGGSPSDLKPPVLPADKERTHLTDLNSQPFTHRGVVF